MLTTNPPAAPFLPARWYSVGQLRAVSKEILERTRADADFAARMRVQDQKAIPWSKSWQEEIYPCSLLADRISLTDDDTFYWTPDGAADVEFRASGKALRVQCTMAFAERPDFVGKQGGHLRKLEVKHANVEGFSFPGGFVSRPRARSEENELDEWRAGIVKALRKQDQADIQQMLVAHLCAQMRYFDTIEYDFDNVVAPAVSRRSGDRCGRKRSSTVYLFWTRPRWPSLRLRSRRATSSRTMAVRPAPGASNGWPVRRRRRN